MKSVPAPSRKNVLRPLIVPMLALIACASPLAARPQVKLTLWSHHRHMESLTRELLSQFNRTTGREKGIEVSMRILGDDSWDVFQEAQKRGQGPDLYSAGFITGYADPFTAGAQAWFDDLPGFEAWKKQWPSWYWVEGMTTYRGHVYAIPSQVFNSRLIYNRDLFLAAGLDPDKPPRSYAELRVAAKLITAKGQGRVFGFAYCGADTWPLEWMPSQWAEANGDPAYWDWQKGRWAMQGFGRVFQLLLDLKQDGSLFSGASLLTNDALRAQFAEGRIGMFMGESWDVGVLNDQFRAKCDWGVAPIPTYDGRPHGKPRAMMLGGLWTINGQCRYKQEAWEVVKWFDRYEIRARLYEHGKNIDPDPIVAAKYVKQRPRIRGFEAFAGTLDRDYLATYPYLPGWKAPASNPCTVFRQILAKGGDLATALRLVDELWNGELDRYFETHPEVKRGWNTYPEFDRVSGRLGPPLEKPMFPQSGK
ncbi:MAG: ABC transporter substrate-binding protein [Bacteroidota bacterium]